MLGILRHRLHWFHRLIVECMWETPYQDPVRRWVIPGQPVAGPGTIRTKQRALKAGIPVFGRGLWYTGQRDPGCCSECTGKPAVIWEGYWWCVISVHYITIMLIVLSRFFLLEKQSILLPGNVFQDIPYAFINRNSVSVIDWMVIHHIHNFTNSHMNLRFMHN